MRKVIYISALLFLFQCGVTKTALDGTNNVVPQNQLFVDELSQIYILEPNNTIVKYDMDANKLFEYSDNTLGQVHVLDVSNPLQILAFHRDFQTVKIFDRTLILNSQIDLNSMNLFEIRTVASANDNRIWIFDELNQELLKVDKNGNARGNNNDLRLRLQENAMPHKMIEYQNTLYMFDSKLGILTFNAFGEYLAQRPVSLPNNFTFLQGELFYKSTEGLTVYNLKEGTSKTIALDEAQENAKGHYIADNRMVCLVDNKIQISNLQ